SSVEPSSTTTTAPWRRARATRGPMVEASLKTGMTIRWSPTASPAGRAREDERGAAPAASETMDERRASGEVEGRRRRAQRTDAAMLTHERHGGTRREEIRALPQIGVEQRELPVVERRIAGAGSP